MNPTDADDVDRASYRLGWEAGHREGLALGRKEERGRLVLLLLDAVQSLVRTIGGYPPTKDGG